MAKKDFQVSTTDSHHFNELREFNKKKLAALNEVLKAKKEQRHRE